MVFSAGATPAPELKETAMTAFSSTILYVADPAASAKFYAGLLQQPIVDQSPNFAMLPLRDGVMLGLWAKSDVDPKGPLSPGGSEIGFTAESADAVRALHAAWKDRGAKIVQAPTQKDFGFTFTAEDQDGHRLRVFHPAAM
jgi:predicted enzyme related to lactoylglutathione lyase